MFAKDTLTVVINDTDREAFDALVEDVKQIGCVISKHKEAEDTFAAYFASNVELIISLRQKFLPRQKLPIAVGEADMGIVYKEMGWEQFVSEQMGITSQYLNRLLKKYLKPAEPETEVTEDEVTEDTLTNTSALEQASARILELEAEVEELQESNVALQHEAEETQALDDCSDEEAFALELKRIIAEHGYAGRIKVEVLN